MTYHVVFVLEKREPSEVYNIHLKIWLRFTVEKHLYMYVSSLVPGIETDGAGLIPDMGIVCDNIVPVSFCF